MVKNKRTPKITLHWANILRNRLKSRVSKCGHSKFSDFAIVKEYVRPILEHAKAEEKRIKDELLRKE